MNFSGINYWKPKGLGENFELSPILAPFAPFRNQMLVVSGLAHRSADASEMAPTAITRGARARG